MFPKRRNCWVSDTSIFNFIKFEGLSQKIAVSESRIITRVFEYQIFPEISAKTSLITCGAMNTNVVVVFGGTLWNLIVM